MDLKIKCEEADLTPRRQFPDDAGIDLRSDRDFALEPGESIVVSSGVAVAIPRGYFGLVAIRSGIGVKHNVQLSNAPGIIDSQYRGVISIGLINHGKKTFVAKRGDRLCQLLVLPCELPDIVIVDSLDDTERGEGGLGSTGR
jgi:dUTP pyrophosphatase